MAINYNNSSVKGITYNGNDVKKLEYNGTIVWCKPYSLTITTDNNVSSYSVTRLSTQEPSAKTGTLSSGATIYHGDQITCSATAKTGYVMNSYNTYINYWVGGNVTIPFTTSASILPPTSLTVTLRTNIQISETATGEGIEYTWRNPNNYNVQTYVYNGNTLIRQTNTVANSYGTILINETNKNFAYTGTLKIYFVNNSLTSSTTSLNYDVTPASEETTTTA